MNGKIRGLAVNCQVAGAYQSYGYCAPNKYNGVIGDIRVFYNDQDETYELFDTPHAVEKFVREAIAEKLASLIVQRDKNKMWPVVNESRDDVLLALRLIRGGIDLDAPKIVSVIVPYLNDIGLVN